MTHRLEVAGLTCTRGDRPLFTHLSFEAAAGELVHVIGSNGSGKTTLLRTVCGLARPAAGEIRWQGKPVQRLGDDYRRALTYVGHLDGVQGELTPAENLKALACQIDAAEDHARIDESLERMGLERLRTLPAKALSQGQRRRLALARLLLVPNPLWILDEPFTALDARSSALLNALIAEHLARDGIALLASHQPLAAPDASVRRVDLERLRPPAPARPEEVRAELAQPAGRRA